MSTGNELALSLGNDFPIHVTLTSEPGDSVVGLTGTYYWPTAAGGDPIADSEGSLTEDTSTPSTARVYRATMNAGTKVNPLVNLASPARWLAIEIEDDMLAWIRVPVIRHRVLS